MRCLICSLFTHKVYIHSLLALMPWLTCYLANTRLCQLQPSIQAELFLERYSFFKPLSVPFRIRYSASGTTLIITLHILFLHATQIRSYSNSSTQYCNSKIHVVLANTLYALWLMHAGVVDCFRQSSTSLCKIQHSRTKISLYLCAHVQQSQTYPFQPCCAHLSYPELCVCLCTVPIRHSHIHF